ncbi:MAG: nuclear transport factor 2 family protein [Pyrinomonadaceae bacterium]
MFKKAFILIGLIFVLTTAFRAQNGLSAKDIEAIKNIEETYRTAWLKNDEKTILSLFTDDATLYPNGNDPVKGKEEMHKFWFAPSDTVTTINTFELKIADIHGSKDYATATGTNELGWTMENKSKNEIKRFIGKGYFISVYVKSGRDWKIFKQFWSGKTEEVK